MKYKFAIENKNYEDYSSGRVFYNQKGATSFPIRLASEIYQRCTAILSAQGLNQPYVLYDPCCGGAYLLTSIGYLHGEEISKIYASDIDETIIPLARKNLSLLTASGLEERIYEIKHMIAAFGKDSHSDGLQSALNLKTLLKKRTHPIETKCFVADITKNDSIIHSIQNVNILITDLPYGDIVNWNDMQDEHESIENLLDNVLPILATNSVISIISKNKTKIKHKDYKQVERFVIGKRQITIFQPHSF